MTRRPGTVPHPNGVRSCRRRPTLPAATVDNASYSAYLGEMSRLVPLRIPVQALKTNLMFDAPDAQRGSGSSPGQALVAGRRERHEVLTGHFLGLYASGGKYDLQWKRDDYQPLLWQENGRYICLGLTRLKTYIACLTAQQKESNRIKRE